MKHHIRSKMHQKKMKKIFGKDQFTGFGFPTIALMDHQIQKEMTKPVIGLSLLTLCFSPDTAIFFYLCHVCEEKCLPRSLCSHLYSSDHCSNYFTYTDPNIMSFSWTPSLDLSVILWKEVQEEASKAEGRQLQMLDLTESLLRKLESLTYSEVIRCLYENDKLRKLLEVPQERTMIQAYQRDPSRKHPLLGMQHVVECVGPTERRHYLCTLCKLTLSTHMIIKHVLSFDHIYCYFREYHPSTLLSKESYSICSPPCLCTMISNLAKQTEEIHGSASTDMKEIQLDLSEFTSVDFTCYSRALDALESIRKERKESSLVTVPVPGKKLGLSASESLEESWTLPVKISCQDCDVDVSYFGAYLKHLMSWHHRQTMEDTFGRVERSDGYEPKGKIPYMQSYTHLQKCRKHSQPAVGVSLLVMCVCSEVQVEPISVCFACSECFLESSAVEHLTSHKHIVHTLLYLDPWKLPLGWENQEDVGDLWSLAWTKERETEAHHMTMKILDLPYWMFQQLFPPCFTTMMMAFRNHYTPLRRGVPKCETFSKDNKNGKFPLLGRHFLVMHYLCDRLHQPAEVGFLCMLCQRRLINKEFYTHVFSREHITAFLKNFHPGSMNPGMDSELLQDLAKQAGSDHTTMNMQEIQLDRPIWEPCSYQQTFSLLTNIKQKTGRGKLLPPITAKKKLVPRVTLTTTNKDASEKKTMESCEQAGGEEANITDEPESRVREKEEVDVRSPTQSENRPVKAYAEETRSSETCPALKEEITEEPAVTRLQEETAAEPDVRLGQKVRGLSALIKCCCDGRHPIYLCQCCCVKIQENAVINHVTRAQHQKMYLVGFKQLPCPPGMKKGMKFSHFASLCEKDMGYGEPQVVDLDDEIYNNVLHQNFDLALQTVKAEKTDGSVPESPLNPAPSEAQFEASADAQYKAPPEAPPKTPSEAPSEVPVDTQSSKAPPDTVSEALPDALSRVPPHAPSMAPPDAMSRVSSDTVSEAPPDAMPRVPPDALTVAPPDTLSKAPPDALSKAPPDALFRVPPHAPSVAPPDALSNAPPDALPKIPPDALSKAPPDALFRVPPHAPSVAPPGDFFSSPQTQREAAALQENYQVVAMEIDWDSEDSIGSSSNSRNSHIAVSTAQANSCTTPAIRREAGYTCAASSTTAGATTAKCSGSNSRNTTATMSTAQSHSNNTTSPSRKETSAICGAFTRSSTAVTAELTAANSSTSLTTSTSTAPLTSASETTSSDTAKTCSATATTTKSSREHPYANATTVKSYRVHPYTCATTTKSSIVHPYTSATTTKSSRVHPYASATTSPSKDSVDRAALTKVTATHKANTEPSRPSGLQEVSSQLMQSSERSAKVSNKCGKSESSGSSLQMKKPMGSNADAPNDSNSAAHSHSALKIGVNYLIEVTCGEKKQLYCQLCACRMKNSGHLISLTHMLNYVKRKYPGFPTHPSEIKSKLDHIVTHLAEIEKGLGTPCPQRVEVKMDIYKELKTLPEGLVIGKVAEMLKQSGGVRSSTSDLREVWTPDLSSPFGASSPDDEVLVWQNETAGLFPETQSEPESRHEDQKPHGKIPESHQERTHKDRPDPGSLVTQTVPKDSEKTSVKYSDTEELSSAEPAKTDQPACSQKAKSGPGQSVCSLRAELQSAPQKPLTTAVTVGASPGCSHLSTYLSVKRSDPGKILGLKSIWECRGIKQSTFFLCESCSERLFTNNVCQHIESDSHHRNYMVRTFRGVPWWKVEDLPLQDRLGLLREAAEKVAVWEHSVQMDAKCTLLPPKDFEYVKTAPFSEALKFLQDYEKEETAESSIFPPISTSQIEGQLPEGQSNEAGSESTEKWSAPTLEADEKNNGGRQENKKKLLDDVNQSKGYSLETCSETGSVLAPSPGPGQRSEEESEIPQELRPKITGQNQNQKPTKVHAESSSSFLPKTSPHLLSAGDKSPVGRRRPAETSVEPLSRACSTHCPVKDPGPAQTTLVSLQPSVVSVPVSVPPQSAPPQSVPPPQSTPPQLAESPAALSTKEKKSGPGSEGSDLSRRGITLDDLIALVNEKRSEKKVSSTSSPLVGDFHLKREQKFKETMPEKKMQMDPKAQMYKSADGPVFSSDPSSEPRDHQYQGSPSKPGSSKETTKYNPEQRANLETSSWEVSQLPISPIITVRLDSSKHHKTRSYTEVNGQATQSHNHTQAVSAGYAHTSQDMYSCYPSPVAVGGFPAPAYQTAYTPSIYQEALIGSQGSGTLSSQAMGQSTVVPAPAGWESLHMQPQQTSVQPQQTLVQQQLVHQQLLMQQQPNQQLMHQQLIQQQYMWSSAALPVYFPLPANSQIITQGSTNSSCFFTVAPNIRNSMPQVNQGNFSVPK